MLAPGPAGREAGRGGEVVFDRPGHSRGMAKDVIRQPVRVLPCPNSI